MPSSARGMPGIRVVPVMPMSRRTKLTTPTPRRSALAIATTPSEPQSERPARGRWSAVQPSQLRSAMTSKAGTTAR